MRKRHSRSYTVLSYPTMFSYRRTPFARLNKVAVLYSLGRVDEAESLFMETQKQKLDFMSAAMVDSIIKGDRAMAMGDYKTVEIYCLKVLDRTFPKPTNSLKLSLHYELGRVYEKLGENSTAVTHYKYCAEFGGETALKSISVGKSQSLS